FAGPAGRAGGPAVDPVEQALVAEPAQVAPDRLDRYAELAGQVVGGHGAVLAHLGQDRLAPLGRQHRRAAPPLPGRGGVPLDPPVGLTARSFVTGPWRIGPGPCGSTCARSCPILL